MISQVKTNLLIIFLLILHLLASAQESWRTLSSDDIFLQAREKAFNGKREEARQMLRYALEKSPDYHDIRILLGRTYAWDAQREEARKEFRMVLSKSPEH